MSNFEHAEFLERMRLEEEKRTPTKKTVWVLNFHDIEDSSIKTLGVFSKEPSLLDIKHCMVDTLDQPLNMSVEDYEELIDDGVIFFGGDGEITLGLSNIVITEN